jgi:hypothetical protein
MRGTEKTIQHAFQNERVGGDVNLGFSGFRVSRGKSGGNVCPASTSAGSTLLRFKSIFVDT